MKILSLDKRNINPQFIKCTNTNRYLVVVNGNKHVFPSYYSVYIAKQSAATICKNIYGIPVNRNDIKFIKQKYL